MTAIRRLAAILAADVAGYSRLMGTDEEGTLERLKALRRELIDPRIADHHGRIVKTTGDGLLVEFASVVDAVRCAVAIQQDMAARNLGVAPAEGMAFRIGINLGDVIAEGDDLYGDGVNIAARLEALTEPGSVFVSHAVYEHVRDRLPFAFADLGEHQVKNIARPLHVYRVGPRVSGPHAGETQAVQSAPLPLPDKPSVAVLPFANMSSDPEQEFLADGIAEDVITALSRHPSLFVIARNSCFTYKGRAVDVKQIGRELGVRYVLEGSLRKSGSRIRVTAQLVEAGAGKHVWTERYDRDLADIFAIQDEISEAVAIAVAPAVADAEQRWAMRKPPGSLDAWAAYQRGLWHHSKLTADDNAIAQKFFQQAIDLDPDFAGGYRGLGWTLLVATANAFQRRDMTETLGAMEALARRAVLLDSGDAEAYVWLGTTLLALGDAHGALVETERALAMSPNLASAHGALSGVLIYSGRPKEGLAAFQRYFRLDPRDPGVAIYSQQVAAAHYFCREYGSAVEAAKRVIRFYPDYPSTYRWLAAALGQLDDTAEARKALEKAIAVAPASFDLYARGRVPWMRPEDHAHMLEGLRKAGWQD
ncbi:MAG TPA: adenylate/guanylate cyclase domain-containing protein [Stellaceae bacterium]|nr:adenylate/guanylate cyclase domain-containing protein [Stellaceae bacterium]